MRVIQTKNDTIRLIFNPKTDGLCLSDFLIVRDGKDNFLAQIVEIYDDKFNQEENVASIKLVYRILPDYQVVPYDNFTPSRECEIAKIKPEEIEKCLNIDKTTVPFGISTKNNRTVNINLDFFNNNPVIFADKLDEVNCAFENIAQKLKTHKTVVAIDYTGNLNIKNAKRIVANADFKLPLDYYSLDYIWEKALKEATPEGESELQDMFVELKKFVESTEDKYIPFPRFIKVIEQQYKATPAPDLRLLLTKLKKYSNDGLFSRSKKEFQAISKAMQKENAIIIDFSNLKLDWHKEFLEFVVRQIKDFDCYLLLRLNENNSNPELISNLYLKNPKISIISSISYGFVKMPQVMEFVNNYILYKTLNPRRDFGFAAAQIASLNSSSFMIFGKDTMDFMFTLKNYIYDEEDIKKVEDKKIYIDLNLELEEMTPVELLEGNFDLKNLDIRQNNQKRLSDEVAIDDILPGYEQNQKERLNNQEHALADSSVEKELKDIPFVEDEVQAEETDEKPAEDIIEAEIEAEEIIEETKEELKERQETKETEAAEQEEIPYTLEDTENSQSSAIQEEEPKQEDTSASSDNSKVAELIEASLKNDEAYIKGISDNKENEIPLNEDELDYFVNPDAEEKEDDIITSEMITDAVDAENLANEIAAQTKEEVVIKKNAESAKELLREEPAPKEELKEQEETLPKEEEPVQETKEEMPGEAVEVPKTEEAKEPQQAVEETKAPEEPLPVEEPKEETKEKDEKETLESIKQQAHEALQKEIVENKKQNPSEAIIIVKEKPNLLIDDFTEDEPQKPEETAKIEESVKSEEPKQVQNDDDISLKELAQKSIETRFDEVIKEAVKTEIQKKKQLKINENVSIDIEQIKKNDNSTQSSLPIFNNSEEDEDTTEYDFVEGMKVSHQNYGAGTIIKVVKYSNKCLLQIEFEQIGKRLLDPKIAKIKPLQ